MMFWGPCESLVSSFCCEIRVHTSRPPSRDHPRRLTDLEGTVPHQPDTSEAYAKLRVWILILAGSNIRNQEFQLGTGLDYSILEIANAFDHHFEFIEARRGDRPKGLADITSTKDVLGYEPTYNIIDYIKSL